MKLQGLCYILSGITNIYSKMFTANNVRVVVVVYLRLLQETLPPLFLTQTKITPFGWRVKIIALLYRRSKNVNL